MGGFDANFNDDVVEEYNTSTNTWNSVASLPTGRANLAAASINNKMYAMGGTGPVNTVEEYDPATDTWTTVASLNTARRRFGAAAAEGNVYAVGGQGPSNNSISSVEELSFNDLFKDVYSATGDTLLGIDDPNGKLLNRTTGVEVTSEDLIARDSQTIAAVTDKQARIYRTEET
jgi:N-acetylneuraminic acid mutarotase